MLASIPIALAACGAAAAATASWSPPPALPRPDYMGYALDMQPAVDATFTARTCPRKGVCNAAPTLASLHAAVWEATLNYSYVPRASALMLTYVASWANATANGTQPNTDEFDFFACEPIAVAMRGLVRAPGGLDGWTDIDMANIKRAMTDECSPEMRGVWNQAMSRAAGTAIALQAFPELDPDGSWLAYAANVWSDWTSAHAYAENSPVYNAIFWFELFTLGEALSPALAAADARSAPTLGFCAHYRDLVAPSGVIASYGDSWSGAGVNATSWAPTEAFWWPSVFERCATAAQQAPVGAVAPEGLAWAAAANFFYATGGWQAGGGATCAPPQPPPGPVTPAGPPDARDLRQVVQAAYWRAQQAPAVASAYPPLSTALLSRRKQPVGDLAPDKLVLTPERAPGAAQPYAVSELWHASVLYHTHISQVGALTYYAAGGTTFLRHAGRDNILPEMASTMQLWRDPANASAFPFRSAETFIHPGAWALAEQPTAHMSPFPSMAPADYFRRNLSHLHFFVDNAQPQGEALQLSLAYIHLYNAATGAVLVLDDFAHVDYVWPNASIAVEPDAPGPTRAVLTIRCAPGLSNNTRPQSAAAPLNVLFDARDWPLLRFHWRVSANAPRNATNLLTVTTGPYTIPEGDYAAQPVIGSCYDWASGGIGPGAPYAQAADAAPVAELLYPSFAPNVTEALADGPTAAGGDSLGAFTVRGHFSSGVAWSRRLVLLAEGPLLVLDAVAVMAGDAADAGGWLAGPAWQLQLLRGAADLSPVPGHANAFEAAGFNATGCYGANVGEAAADRLLVALDASSAGGPAPVYGAAAAAFVGRVSSAAPYAHLPLRAAAGPARFVSLLLPHGAGDDAAGLAARFAVAPRAPGATGTTVTVPLVAGLYAGGAATVTVADDALTWSVARSAGSAP